MDLFIWSNFFALAHKIAGFMRVEKWWSATFGVPYFQKNPDGQQEINTI